MTSPTESVGVAPQGGVSIELSSMPAQPTQAPDHLSARNLETTDEETGHGVQTAEGLVPSKPLSDNKFQKIVNVCVILALVLDLTFGVAQWVAQNKSTAVAKESELITLALSCGDEKIKNTSTCQQFLEKYPDGPVISRRENVKSMQDDPYQTAAHIATTQKYIQEEDDHIRTMMDTSNSKEYQAHTGDTVETGNVFLPDMTPSETSSAFRRSDNDSSIPSKPSRVNIAFLLRTIAVVYIFTSCTFMVAYRILVFYDRGRSSKLRNRPKSKRPTWDIRDPLGLTTMLLVFSLLFVYWSCKRRLKEGLQRRRYKNDIL